MIPPGFVLALESLSQLHNKLKGGIFNMENEKETRTVTIPLSDFEEMRSKAAQYTALRNTLRFEVEMEYKNEMKSISELYDKYYEKYSESYKRVKELESEIEYLKCELERCKSRKRWKIWKR